MRNAFQSVMALMLVLAMFISNFTGMCFAADNMATIEFRNCGHGQIVGPERIEVTTGSAITVSDAFATTLWDGNTDSAAFLYWVLSDPNGHWLHVEGETFIPTEAKTYTFDLVPMYGRFKVRYESNGATGGTVPASSMTYGDNSSNEPLTVVGNVNGLTKDGFIFNGWNTSPDGSGTAYSGGETITKTAPQSVTRLYAVWTPKPKYIVNYTCDEKQGSITKSSDEVTPGEALVLPQITANRGWRLLGWCSDDGMIEKLPGDTIIVSSNLNLKAVFVPALKLAFNYDANGADSGIVPKSEQVYYANENVIVSNNTGNISKNGFVFDCWNTKADGSGTDYQSGQNLVMSEAVILYAKWKVGVLSPPSPPMIPVAPPIPVKPAGDNGASSKPDTREKDAEQTAQKPPAPIVKVIPKEETPLGKLNAEDHFAYMSGYPDKTFRPNGSITRAEIAVILFRLLDDPQKDNYTPSKSSFSDVKINSWYGKPVLYLSQMGVLKGDGEGKFNPNAPISRAELATVISKFYQLESVDRTPLTDINGHWAEAYIRSAYSKKWITASADGTYRPDANMSRVDTLSLINNALGRKVEKGNIAMNEIVRFTDIPDNYQYFEGIVETTNTHLYRLENGLEVWNSIINNQVVVSN